MKKYSLRSLCLVALVFSYGCEQAANEPAPMSQSVAQVHQKSEPSSDNNNAGRGADVCAEICAKAKARACPIQEAACVAACEEMIASEECRSEMHAALSCLAGLDNSAWTCGEEGFPEVRPGHCESEQGLMVKCLSPQVAH